MQFLTKTLNLGKDFYPRQPISGPCRGLFCVVFCNFACVKALCPAPLMQNYMIKSVKMTKKSIFRDHFSWKVRNFAQNLCENGQSSESQHACMIGRVAPDEGKANGLHLGKERALCTRFAPSLSHAFRKGCRSFCCSISPTNCNLKRDLMSKSKYTLKLRTIAQTSTIVYLGLLQACRRIWDGACAFFMPIPIVLPPYQTLMREL